ncbi:hypothetical protein HYPDE_38868 [Hyphomicrobium denitrificans 1NES1]|uniref:Uncharacterized protein n=1 Tax=Hyphomicrobium denitrificans 1NES1 TaxID=670307 RepID=N0B8T0_9HYPH|nr:hypothetical protein HYPDE_38868 [Hyphomicrobium denitrificans 1NES1]
MAQLNLRRRAEDDPATIAIATAGGSNPAKRAKSKAALKVLLFFTLSFGSNCQPTTRTTSTVALSW